MSDKVVEEKNLLRVSIDFIENSNKGAVFDYIRQSIKLFIFHSLLLWILWLLLGNDKSALNALAFADILQTRFVYQGLRPRTKSSNL
jgi:hypothetical protein